jgi:hypothetical protein
MMRESGAEGVARAAWLGWATPGARFSSLSFMRLPPDGKIGFCWQRVRGRSMFIDYAAVATEDVDDDISSYVQK